MIVKGQKINDRYEVIRLIGEGGMANVYLAHDTILDRDVAVKVLRGDLASDEKFIRRFQREAISASSLSHPNIVEIYDVGEDNGDYYIVMEYVPGKTLKSLIKKRGALTIPEVLDIMLQLTAGVATAHASYIIHRDLKPQNVLILDDGMVKITDFGIAMALNSKELTQTNSVMGSVHYLPPEQASGSGSTIKSDIYSLGIMMYELLTGKLPFKGENAVEIAIKQMKEPIPSVRAKNPDIPQSVENIILKACAKNPKNRYENVLEMREDLENCMKEEHAADLRVEYKYPEQDLEATKVMPSLKNAELVKDDDEEEETISDKSNKFKVVGYILGTIIIGVAAFFVFLSLTTVPDVVVPDVSGKSIVDAETALKEKGFTINPDNEEQESDTVEPGLVIKTEPVAGVTRKKGTEITLIVSKKPESVELEDYTGKNYYEVKATLEAKGIYVLVEKKTVEDTTNAVADNIIAQTPEKGTKVTKGDTVTLYIADITDKYPDFVAEGWSVDDVQAFADKYSLTLEIENEETTSSKVGTILKQSRAAGSKIIAKATLKITVAKAPAASTSADSSAKVN
jgi:serine/threonine protein kinase